MTTINRRQFITGAATLAGSVAAMGGFAATAFADEAAEAGAQQAVAGAVAGSGVALGKGGDVELEAVLEDGVLKQIHVVRSQESRGVGTTAIEQLSQLVIDGQSLNFDAVSGATLSSAAFRLAMADALDNAGEDSGEWMGREKVAPSLPEDFATSYDVVVVGAGGTGYAAAITAAEAGCSVLLMEKLGITGGDTILSGGGICVPGNYFQKLEGIEDSAELLAEDMLAGGDYIGDPELVKVIAEGSYGAMEWLTFEGGISWQPYQQFFGGHSVARSLIPAGQTGGELIVKLAQRCKAIPEITIVCNFKADELVVGDDGAVCGVKATDLISGAEHAIDAKAVVLATGGFGNNIEMRTKYNPDMGEGILSTDAVGATGDGHLMAEAIGAELIDMEYIQTYPTCDIQTGGLLYTGNMRLNERAICVNKEGDRYVEELERRDVISNATKEQTDGVGYMVFNQALVDETQVFMVNAPEVENLTGRGMLVKGDTLEEACEPFGIDAAELAQTIERWNGFCEAGHDDDFNYRGTFHAIEGGPYYVIVFKPSVHYTMGGLHINPEAEVLNTDGATIPALFAAGEVAGHKMGDNRLGSCSIADIFVFGRIAGANAAALV